MTIFPLTSTTLTAVAYEHSRHLLRVQFRNGACYQYAPVPSLLFADLLAAPSQGAFFNRFIRGKFLFLKLAPRLLN